MAHGVSRALSVSVLLLTCLALIPACRTAPTAEAPQTTPPAFETPSAEPAERVDETTGFKAAEPRTESVQESPSSLAEKLNTQEVLKRIHFDFDRYDLTPESIRTLGANAARMKEYQQFKVRIEGHCDERGTVEYNLALGEKRARAARDYLVSLGTPARRLSIISFGKERPMEPGHNEDAWALNRRAEFIFQAE